MACILITGGAGYIGSHVSKQLLETTQDKITILDNLSSGSIKTIDTLKKIRDFDFVNLDLNQFNLLDELLNEKKFDVIMHFAASIVVPESVSNPIKYYMNNTVNTTNLINCSLKYKINKFIFSSTAAVYGEPLTIPIKGIDESYETKPINPYGMSKLLSEKVLIDSSHAYKDFKYVIFRYFNVAGADINYQECKLLPRIGQSFPNATHLIKIASECANEKRNKMFIFGDSFNTKDGTGVRDYIHVDDLASAHVKAISYLEDNTSDIFNVGYGIGFSVKDVIDQMKISTGKDFEVLITKKRDGDPACLISNNSKIVKKMNWSPKYNSLDLICKSAFEWEKNLK